MIAWLALAVLTSADAAPADKTCRWALGVLDDAATEADALEVIAEDREHTWSQDVVDCLRGSDARLSVVLEAQRHATRGEAAGATTFAVDPTDAQVTAPYEAAVAVSKRVEVASGWTSKVVLQPTFVDAKLPPWFDMGVFLDALRFKERPDSTVPALDLPDELAANVDEYTPMPEGRLGDPLFTPRLIEAPLGWIVDRHDRVLWLDVEPTDDGVAVTWAMNRLQGGPPFPPVGEPERLVFRAQERDLSAVMARASAPTWPPARAATLGAGAALFAGGIGMIAGTFATYDPTLDTATTVAPANQTRIDVNSAGWGVAVTGGIAAILGAALPAKVWAPKRKR